MANALRDPEGAVLEQRGEPELSVIPLATQDSDGLMSAEDKGKLDGMDAGGGSSGFPESASDGDVMMWSADEAVGNGAHTRLLLQPITSEGAIVDSAAGNVSPLVINNSGVTVDAENQMVFSSGKYLQTAVALSDVFDGASGWCIDVILTPNVSYDIGFLRPLGGDGGQINMGVSGSEVTLWLAGGTQYSTGKNTGEEFRFTAEQSATGVTFFVDGAVIGFYSGASFAAAGAGFQIGGDGGQFVGTVAALRVRNIAPYGGVAFAPDASPFVPPVGAWTKTSLAALKEKLDALA